MTMGDESRTRMGMGGVNGDSDGETERSGLGGDGDGDRETECKRLDVGGMSNMGNVASVDLGRENEGHRFLARFETAGIAACRRRGPMVRRDGAG